MTWLIVLTDLNTLHCTVIRTCSLH